MVSQWPKWKNAAFEAKLSPATTSKNHPRREMTLLQDAMNAAKHPVCKMQMFVKHKDLIVKTFKY